MSSSRFSSSARQTNVSSPSDRRGARARVRRLTAATAARRVLHRGAPVGRVALEPGNFRLAGRERTLEDGARADES